MWRIGRKPAVIATLHKDLLEAIRHYRVELIVAAIGFVGGWLLNLAKKTAGLPSGATYHEIAAAAIDAAKNLPDFVALEIHTRPIVTGLFAILAVGFIILGRLLKRAHDRVESQGEKLKEADTYKALIDAAGLGGRWPHAAIDGSGAPWDDLRTDIAHPTNTVLYILGANGIDTFGREGSPLHEAMQKFQGTIRVILCSPKNTNMIGRAESLGVDPGDYKRAISRSVKWLKELAAQNHAIEGRYYSGIPNWKMIITSQALWLQYYKPGGSHIERTPVYRFDAAGDDGMALYHLFHMEFDRIWNRCTDDVMPLRNGNQRTKPKRRRR